MRGAFSLALANVVLAMPSAAAAKDKPPKFVTSSHVADKPAVSLDPAQAYIVLRAETQTALYLMRVPTDEDQAVYARLRADAFAESHAKYVKKLASYQTAQADAAAKGGPRPKDDGGPVEPTEANFEFTAFGLLAPVPIGPANRFAKGAGGASTYLEAVTPGRYRIYGPIVAGQNNQMFGACFCMGSVSFDARAGEIVDLGLITKPDADAVPAGMTSPGLVSLKPTNAGVVIDARLAKATIRPAAFRPVGKLPNYFGLPITRMAEMPGVMRYDRDRIVDLTTSK